MVPEQWDRRSKLAAVSHRLRTARQSSTWERGKIGGRRRIHTEKTKTITIIDTRIRIHTITSRRVKLKSTFGGPPCMRRSSASVHAYMVALPRHSSSADRAGRLRAFSWVEAQCCHLQLVAEQRSKALAMQLHKRQRLSAEKRAL